MSPIFNEIELAPLRALLSRSQKIVLVTHVYPDGDAVGSLQGLAGFLRALGKEVQTIIPTPCPDYLSFLNQAAPHKIWIHRYTPKACIEALQGADAIFCLDINMLSRLEALGDIVRTLPQPKILIDHHLDPIREEFDMVFSVPGLSSSCEVLYRLMVQLAMLKELPPSIAEPLYVGLMTDTNNFSNSVTAETFEVAAALLHTGVCKEKVQQYVFGDFSEHRMRFMAHAVLNKMVLIKPHRAAYIALSLVEQEQFGFRVGDTEGFVNIPLNISGVDISMLFVETADFIRVSLRSRPPIDVNEMAKRFFNGGGHRLASGGKLYCSFMELPGVILHALENATDKTLAR